MLKDITLGQYFPGNSVLHRLDPRIKIVLTVLLIALLFCVKNFLGFGVIFLFVCVLTGISHIGPRVILKSVKPLLFVIVLTAVFNIFYGSGEPVFQNISWLGWLTWGGLKNAAFMGIRIILLIICTSFMTYTTSPVMLTDAIERLLTPLKKIKLPVHEFAMMMTIALRFIPTLIDETEKIINAQKARGADFETGNLVARAKALVPIMIPLIVSAFRRAEELADAMECRCYHGGDGRTRYKVYSLKLADYVAVFVLCALFVLIILLNVL